MIVKEIMESFLEAPRRPVACGHDPSPQKKITFGELRASGVRDVLIYCRDHRCSHHSVINADRWEDRLRLSDVEPTLTCSLRLRQEGQRDQAVLSGSADGRGLSAVCRPASARRRSRKRRTTAVVQIFRLVFHKKQTGNQQHRRENNN